jgi:hypothetical protein
MLAVISTLLWLGGIAGLVVWLVAHRRMIRERTWAEQDGSGSYLWLLMYVVMIVVGTALRLRH